MFLLLHAEESCIQKEFNLLCSYRYHNKYHELYYSVKFPPPPWNIYYIFHALFIWPVFLLDVVKCWNHFKHQQIKTSIASVQFKTRNKKRSTTYSDPTLVKQLKTFCYRLLTRFWSLTHKLWLTCYYRSVCSSQTLIQRGLLFTLFLTSFFLPCSYSFSTYLSPAHTCDTFPVGPVPTLCAHQPAQARNASRYYLYPVCCILFSSIL